jgi:hypothetical protein
MKVMRFDTLVGAEAELEKGTERGERAYILPPFRNNDRASYQMDAYLDRR